MAKYTPIEPVPGAEGVYSCTWYDPARHEPCMAECRRQCKTPELKAKADELEAKFLSGDFPPCCFKERMMVADMTKGGVMIYSAVPINDDMKAWCNDKGGVKVIVVPTAEHAKDHGGWIEAFPEAIVICSGGVGMAPTIAELGDKANVLDFNEPKKWSQVAIKALTGWGYEVLDTSDFQEIVIMHRKSKTLFCCDSIYLGTSDKNDKSGWKAFADPAWSELYFAAYFERTTSLLPIHRTFLNEKQQKDTAKTIKKIVSWKAERVMAARMGKISEGGAEEAKKIIEGHWGWCKA